ncbi:LysR substrate-binding domain-containing protein [Nitratireductor indicus]|uniref:LysR family transcriptional regulator n=1 Tax=Nitratireductor indicus C115 TaxID=1231190 RepID=K2NK59_9HYPH|nr:LysR substrate-binding domain-containing protein [Nitratireductor indicus]EKF39835.1 LysR family transcriptional regulator [Nitratireductor indicus C115]MDS1136186.1 LysR substrate-binding domain-containing protein [Nitratireductor indicus]SFQ82258.1 LysR family transcriptional regulator, regulatory protein for tcuABC [Nitratireductor indicus]
MDVRQLKYFVTIVDCAGFSQASRQLNIAQPALSQQISRLEYEVGAPLLTRSSRGASPTPKGVTLYRHAKFILRQIDQALVSTRETEAEVSGRVTLGLPPTTICQTGMQIVERVQRRYPGILLNVVEGLSGSLQAQAGAGDLDLTVLFAPAAVPDWTATELLREELFLVFPVESRIFPDDVKNVSIREIADVPLILPSSHHGLRRRVDLEFERLELIVVPIAEIDSLPVLMHCLQRGLGATIKPRAAINVHGAALASQWRCLPIRDVSMNRVNYLYAPPEEALSPAISAVHAELIALIREEVAERRWTGVTWIGPEAD